MQLFNLSNTLYTSLLQSIIITDRFLILTAQTVNMYKDQTKRFYFLKRCFYYLDHCFYSTNAVSISSNAVSIYSNANGILSSLFDSKFNFRHVTYS